MKIIDRIEKKKLSIKLSMQKSEWKNSFGIKNKEIEKLISIFVVTACLRGNTVLYVWTPYTRVTCDSRYWSSISAAAASVPAFATVFSGYHNHIIRPCYTCSDRSPYDFYNVPTTSPQRFYNISTISLRLFYNVPTTSSDTTK